MAASPRYQEISSAPTSSEGKPVGYKWQVSKVSGRDEGTFDEATTAIAFGVVITLGVYLINGYERARLADSITVLLVL